MQDFHNSARRDLEAILGKFMADISVLHSSRATPALVENITVSAYGQKLPLKELASLSAPDARTIVVQPWDLSILAEIQKAIVDSHLGMGSATDEKFIRLTMPQLSQERRREIIKVLGGKTEEARISMRRIRDHVLKSLEDAQRKKEISEDEKFRSKEAVQKLIDEYNARVLEGEAKKVREIEGS